MRGILMFGAGLGLGYVLGTRAGRERYRQISEKAKQVWESKTVQDAAGAVQEQAGRLSAGGERTMSGQTQEMPTRHQCDPQRPGERQDAHTGRAS